MARIFDGLIVSFLEGMIEAQEFRNLLHLQLIKAMNANSYCDSRRQLAKMRVGKADFQRCPLNIITICVDTLKYWSFYPS